MNGNGTAYEQECVLSSSTEYYWYRKTLDTTSTIEESGGVPLHLLAMLSLAWLIVALCVIKGISSAGKVRHKCSSTCLQTHIKAAHFQLQGLVCGWVKNYTSALRGGHNF